MHAFADGATIEQRDPRIVLATMPTQPDHWRDFNGRWQDDMEYRVKPERAYPVSTMAIADLKEGECKDIEFRMCGDPIFGSTMTIHKPAGIGKFNVLKAIANAALRHAIDAGQLVDANHEVVVMGRQTRRARDTAIAEAVRDACRNNFTDSQATIKASAAYGRISNVNLEWLIDSVK